MTGATVADALPKPEPVALDPLYYRDNFLRMCATVGDQYGDLLSADEAGFLCRLKNASRAAQCLYVRMVSRVGPCFRVSALVYPEIPSVDRALEELVSTGLSEFCRGLAPEDAGRLYTVPELRRAFPELAHETSGRHPLGGNPPGGNLPAGASHHCSLRSMRLRFRLRHCSNGSRDLLVRRW